MLEQCCISAGDGWMKMEECNAYVLLGRCSITVEPSPLQIVGINTGESDHTPANFTHSTETSTFELAILGSFYRWKEVNMMSLTLRPKKESLISVCEV